MTLQLFKCCQGNPLNLFSCLFDSGLVEGAATDLGSSMPSGLGRGALRLPANARTAEPCLLKDATPLGMTFDALLES